MAVFDDTNLGSDRSVFAATMARAGEVAYNTVSDSGFNSIARAPQARFLAFLERQAAALPGDEGSRLAYMAEFSRTHFNINKPSKGAHFTIVRGGGWKA